MRTYTDPSYAAAYLAHHAQRPVRDIILGKPDPRSQPHVKGHETRRAPALELAREMRPAVGLA